MNNRFQNLTALTLLCTATAAQAGPTCKEFSGAVRIFPELLGCTVATLPERYTYLPDVLFLGELAAGLPATCFKGAFTAAWGTQALSVKVYSGLTLNQLPQPLPGMALTAATVLHAQDQAGKLIGSAVFQDIIVRDNLGNQTGERLVMVAGDKLFKNTHGSLNIMGDAILGHAPVQGQLCQ